MHFTVICAGICLPVEEFGEEREDNYFYSYPLPPQNVPGSK